MNSGLKSVAWICWIRELTGVIFLLNWAFFSKWPSYYNLKAT